MSRGRRYTSAFKAEVWRRWKSGESCSDIARALGKCPNPMYTLLAQGGGVAGSQDGAGRCGAPLPLRAGVTAHRNRLCGTSTGRSLWHRQRSR